MRVLFLLLLIPCGAAAGTVYKCTDANGAVAFQSRPCADDKKTEEVAIRSAPEPPPLPPASAPDPPPIVDVPPPPAPLPPPRAPSEPVAESWRCSLENGEIWYQHRPCPRRLYAQEHLLMSDGTLGPLVEVSKPVGQRSVSRSEACKEINRPAAATRKGSSRDEKPDAYAKLQGEDPC